MNDPFYQTWSNQTNLHPLSAAAIALGALLMFTLPRRFATWPIILMACLIAPAQRIVIATLDFDLLRIMVVIGWMRLIARNEWRGYRGCACDLAIAVWSLYAVMTTSILSGSVSGFVNALGKAFDAIGMYFLCRALIRDWQDLRTMVLGFVLISIPVAGAFLVESRTARNLFAFLGGVPEITIVRDGRLRCQGAFAHPILAGCFWASVLPLVLAQWWQDRHGKLLAIIGSITFLTIVATCASSTPVAALFFGAVAAVFYFVRMHMRLVRWLLLLSIIALHLSMKAPVWHLIARIDLVGGSTGYHRFNLIDQAIRHLEEWWLMGSTRGTAHWGWGTHDVTNQYLVEGLRGGLVLIALFVAVLSLSFRGVGQLLRRFEHDPPVRRLAWAMGVCIFIHVMNFWAVSYFGQIVMLLYLHLAMVASLSLAPVAAGAALSLRHATPPRVVAQPLRRRPRPPRVLQPDPRLADEPC